MSPSATLPDPSLPFDELVTPRPCGEGRFAVSFPDGWQQGRGAFGGLVLGPMIRAAETIAAERDPTGGRTLRSLTAELCGPTEPGPAALQVEALREGSGVSTLVVRLSQGEAVQAQATCVLGRPRPTSGVRTWLAPPALPPWRELPAAPLGGPFVPRFSQYYEYRVVGPVPFSGAAEPVTSGWIRPRRPGAARDAAYLAACVDGWWPSFFSIEPAPRPVGTIAYTLELVGSLEGLDPDAPLGYFARTVAMREGFAVELRELWGEDGRLVALNQQTVAIIK